MDTLKEDVLRLEIRHPRRRLPDHLEVPGLLDYRIIDDGAARALVMSNGADYPAALGEHLQAEVHPRALPLEELLLELTA